MQATLLNSKKVTTKFGEKILGEVKLSSGETTQIWEPPTQELDKIAPNTEIELERTAKGYKRVVGALTGQDKKKAIAEYSEQQIKYLGWLHKKVAEGFATQGIELSTELIEKYTVTVYLKTTKEFNL